MNAIKSLKNGIVSLLQSENNRRTLKDTALLAVATIVFHFLYWHSDMNNWLFGPFTQQVFEFFRLLAYRLAAFFAGFVIKEPYDAVPGYFFFYHTLPSGVKIYDGYMEVVSDCSGVKQLLQYLLVMVLCRGVWKGKSAWFIGGSVVLLLVNGLRVALLAWICSADWDMFQPVHDWIARPVMYIIIFALWYIWIYRLDKKKNR